MSSGRPRTFEFSHRTRVVVGAGVWLKALAEARAFGEQVLLVTGVSSLTRLGLSAAAGGRGRATRAPALSFRGAA